jgi:O-antigen/teichoic acid export membrane protein
MNSLARFIKSTGIFLVGNMLSKVIVFFLLPVYTAYIPAAGYGYYDLSITYITVVTSLLFFDIWSTIMRYMYDSKDSGQKYRAILAGGSIFACSTVAFGIIGIGVSCLTRFRYLPLIFLYGITNNLMLLYAFMARGFERNTDFAVSGIINTGVMATANLVMIVVLKMDFSALYIAAILGYLIQIIYLEMRLQLIRNLRGVVFDRRLIREMSHYTWPLCLNSVAYWLLTSYNGVVISHVMSVGANGLFAVGNKFAAIIALVTTCFTYAWQDVSFSRQSDDPTNGIFYSKASTMYLRFLCVGAVFALPFIKMVFPLLINRTYGATAMLIPLSLLTAVSGAYSTFVGNIFYATKNTKAIFGSMLLACLVNLLLGPWLIGMIGLNGANLSIFVSFTVNILIRNRILRRQIGFTTNLWQTVLLGIWFGVTANIFFCYGWSVNLLWLQICIVIAALIYKDDLAKIKAAVGQGLKGV